jgi:FKBP-type peptidyl-prolyl cis-trans isomerase 2
MKKIQNGDTVTVNYTGRLEDGTIFDSSLIEGREPLNAKLGEGKLISGFEKGLLEMGVGDKKTIEIESIEAYGDYNDLLVSEIPKSNVPENVKPGDTLQGMTNHGPVIVKILEVKDETVVLDANHPLAGKKLIFDLEVVDIV